jgi:hypothetical protein
MERQTLDLLTEAGTMRGTYTFRSIHPNTWLSRSSRVKAMAAGTSLPIGPMLDSSLIQQTTITHQHQKPKNNSGGTYSASRPAPGAAASKSPPSATTPLLLTYCPPEPSLFPDVLGNFCPLGCVVGCELSGCPWISGMLLCGRQHQLRRQ